jgi:phospholipase/carboxylesterase
MAGTTKSDISDVARRGFLTARPVAGERRSVADPGVQKLGLEERRDGVLFVPRSYDPARPAPLLITLHGAGGVAAHMLGPVEAEAERLGLLVLAPDSRGRTWDVIVGRYGPDVVFIDRALARVLGDFAVDGERVAVSGFSDGASYALSLGIINGGLFSDILAFSPGFAAPTEAHGSPRIFISHGVRDDVLPIEQCSRRLAPRLRDAGYDLDYREFPDGHVVPPEMVTAALSRFLA